jgi:3D (Asp-Asp-Asp) domain-containing protein
MYSPSSLCSSSLLRANIRQNISLIFVSENTTSWSIPRFKKYSHICASVLAFFSFLPSSGYAATETSKEFVVTAYYSPLPDQSFYLKWNYEAEKILNGEGTHGASGKPVFVGMLAAPKTYDFGTRIYLEGLGVGIVEDRGGAIVNAGERGQSYDRIDIWMGSWESGLRRAMVWGKRKVTGTIITDTTKSLLNLRDIDTGKVNLENYTKAGNGSSGILTAGVLDMFADLGYSPEWSDQRSMIIAFQKDHDIIKRSTDEGAWVYGPKTKSTLAKAHTYYVSLRDAELKKIESEKALLISARNEWENSYQIASQKVSSIGSPNRGESGTHIATLQSALKGKGYLKGSVTSVMNGPTIIAVKSFQKSYWLSPTGMIDDSTRAALLAMMAESA